MQSYDELPYGEACKQAVRILGDGLGDALLLKDESGYWVLYYFSPGRAPDPAALPDWLEGPRTDAAGIRAPYEMKAWLEELGYEAYMNDVD